jgi:ABC-type sugar transport system substrate-binding protein
MADPENAFWTDMEVCYRRLAPAMGVSLTVVWPEPGQDPGAQLEGLLRMIREPLDLLVVNPLEPGNLVPGIIEAARKEIPVLDVGAKSDPERLHEAGTCYVPLRTVDFEEQGRLGGGFLVQALGTSPEAPATVVILAGRKEAAQSRGRCRGAEQAFSVHPDAFRLLRESGSFDRSQGREAAARILTVRPDVKGFFCANDLMALGVADACGGLPLERRPRIVGVDGIPEAVEAVQRGLLSATVAFSREEVAQSVLESALRVLSGAPLPEGFLVTSRVIPS